MLHAQLVWPSCMVRSYPFFPQPMTAMEGLRGGENLATQGCVKHDPLISSNKLWRPNESRGARDTEGRGVTWDELNFAFAVTGGGAVSYACA